MIDVCLSLWKGVPEKKNSLPELTGKPRRNQPGCAYSRADSFYFNCSFISLSAAANFAETAVGLPRSSSRR